MEIRAIRADEGDEVAELWDRMCRETPDGGPLTPDGKRNLARMLGMSAWHRDAFCLVAEQQHDAQQHDTRLVGFVNGRLSIGDGLLPGVIGEIDSLYVVPEIRHEGVGRKLAEAAIGHLRGQGAGVLRYLSCIDAEQAHEFWRSLGFVADMVCLSNYSDQHA
ncbi:GNAT family N-acetyltransferase [Catenulispora rubra]|uniref:GNAT family N-acetyltransferase n=1 Tax=Catenulispora rubra TaxID=280293 RepID=UPI0018924D98|nr:GNAT family N-acetyltransferase [Catenulispora rubra]